MNDSVNYQLSVVIPAFNEEGCIEEMVNSLIAMRKAHSLECEFVFVNDGSTDNTRDVLEKMNVIPGMRIINNGSNLGYGAALKRGIADAKSDIICIVDADGSYPVDQIPSMLKDINEYDMVVGARQGPHYWGSFLKRPSRKLFLLMIHYILGIKIPDGNSGLRIFRKEQVMKFFNILGSKYSFSTSLTLAYHYNSFAVKYLDIKYYKRVGRSKVRHVRDSMGMIQLIMQFAMYYDPYKVVFPIFIIFAVISALSFISFFMGWGSVCVLIGFMNAFFSISTLLFGLGVWVIAALIKSLP